MTATPCQRWQDGRHTFSTEERFTPGRYDVAPIGAAAAKAYITRHHYSRRYPADRLRYGLFEGSELVGVAVLSIPVQRSVLTNAFPHLEAYTESLELGRFVLADRVPRNGETWFLSRAFRLAAEAGVRGVVSFSDPLPRRAADGSVVFPGHVGIIYQASNATYAGRSSTGTLRLLPDGEVLNQRSLSKLRNGEVGSQYVEDRLCQYGAPLRGSQDVREWLKIALPAAGVRPVRHPGNHRYLFGLDRAQRRVQVPSLPYPKTVDLVAA